MATDKPRILITVSDELLAKIDEYWHDNRIMSRSEAIRSLLEAALRKSKKAPKK